jgi:hypothetical protein
MTTMYRTSTGNIIAAILVLALALGSQDAARAQPATPPHVAAPAPVTAAAEAPAGADGTDHIVAEVECMHREWRFVSRYRPGIPMGSLAKIVVTDLMMQILGWMWEPDDESAGA